MSGSPFEPGSCIYPMRWAYTCWLNVALFWNIKNNIISGFQSDADACIYYGGH